MSTVVQTTYRPQIAPGVIGMIADEVDSAVATRQCETSAGIGFGLAVSQGTKDRGAIIGGSAFVGVTVRDVTVDRLPINPLSDTEVAADTYQQYQNMGVMSRGHIWVGAGATVKGGDALFYDTTAGTFSNSASGEAGQGSIAFTAQPLDATTVTLNGGAAIVFKNTVTDATTQVQIGPTLGDTLVNLAAFINANPGTDTNIGYFSAVAYPSSPGGSGEGSGANTLLLAAKTVGTGPNSYTIATNVAGATRSASTLLGGTASATAVSGGFWLTAAIAGQPAKISLGIQR